MAKTWRRIPPPLRLLILAGLIPVLCWLMFLVVGRALRFCPEPIGSRAELFRDGAKTTLLLTLLSAALGLALGVSGALSKLSDWKLLRLAAHIYIWIFRGTPLLTQILFVYYALPVLLPWLKLDEFYASIIALSLNVGAYNAEAVRAGILSVPRGQAEAAKCLGFTRFQILRIITLPQALPIMAPPLVNNLVALLKDSAMASSIGLLELTLVGSRISSETFLPVPVLTTIAATYLILTTIISLISHFLMNETSQSTWFTQETRA